MGGSTFKRDLAASEEAVWAVFDYLESKGYEPRELEGKEEQAFGDIRYTIDDKEINVEVKYDMYARRSGNLCFEMSNGKKLTGILATKADYVYYVVPQRGGKRFFVFEIEKLREFINTSNLITTKNGGDGRKFILALAKISDIEEIELAEEIIDV